MRGSVAGTASVLVAAFLLAPSWVACTGAEDDCARDADCPAGSRCVRNGDHRVCLADGGAGGSGGSGGTGGCPDSDGDGVCNDDDLCPEVADPGQEDADGDSVGDACDPCPADPGGTDADGDGLCGASDNCPTVSNPGQEDADADGAGDACDACPADAENDADGDGVCGDVDNCPAVPNAAQADTDGDGAGDACDPCPADPANDVDGDGLCGDVDNCPAVPNAGQEDLDGDGLGDACDPDVDGDGVAEPDDCAPRDAAVYPGAPDPCDGVDSDCVPARCELSLSPAEGGWVVRDVTCASGTRMCVLAGGTSESGRVSLIDLAGAPETLRFLDHRGVRGVALDSNGSPGPFVWAVSDSRIVGYSIDGSQRIELEPESPTLSGRVRYSRFNTLGVAAHSSASTLQFISPEAALAGASSQVCGPTTDSCKAISIRTLGVEESTLGMRSPFDISVRQSSDGVPAQVYCSFADDERLAVAVIGIDGVLRTPFSGLLSLGTGDSSLLAVTPSQSLLFSIGETGIGAAVSLTNDVATHTWQPFDLQACPTAILARDHDLLVASHCAGEEPELIVLPIVDGLPDETAATTLPLPGCTPMRMAGSPRLGDDGPDAVLLGCNDSATVLVLGRD